MNDLRTSASICAETVPANSLLATTAYFARWRKSQTFPTVEIAKKAEHVEADLRALEKGVGPHMLASIARNVREFEAMLRR